MDVIRDIKPLRAVISRARRHDKKIGFVPTMGALHEGHLSLVRKCRRDNDLAVVGIFVNPAQFGPHDDYKNYPREKKDISVLKKENMDILFYPSAKKIYPSTYLTYVEVHELTESLCGKSRPGHFRGVATVVTKLLNVVLPDTLYLGQKDAQQCRIIQKLVEDLNFPVTVKVLPTVREKDGLAMSSRNQYLTAQQRAEAPILYKVLLSSQKAIAGGQRNADTVIHAIRTVIQQHSAGVIDYISCVDAHTLKPLKVLKGEVLVAAAVWFGKARLIDNMIVKLSP